MGRGDAFADAGRLTEAEESYRRALELWPDLLRAQSRLGRVLVQREAYEEGMGLLEPLVPGLPGRRALRHLDGPGPGSGRAP